MYTDAHVHILDTIEELESKNIKDKKIFDKDIFFCASANEASRFDIQEKICIENSENFILSFGIHPQCPLEDEIPYLEKLISMKRITAIGECGFDLFNDQYRRSIEAQKKVWKLQLELAQKSGLPIVVHCRKGLNLIFNDIRILKKIGAVIFHGWAGSIIEAQSFLKKGVNAYFCIGKGLLRGQKAQIEAALKLDLNRLLTETDAPYMSLKEEAFSLPSDIKTVLLSLAELRAKQEGIERFELKILQNYEKKLHHSIFENFKKAYNINVSAH